MLIEFSISNYRSFRERQTFSMVAAPRLKKGDNVFEADVKGEKLPNLLKVAAIYGPNASGKSNLIKAFDIVKQISNYQPSAQSTPLPVDSFRFDSELTGQPSRVEIHFIYAKQRYQFELALTQERIIEERLIVFPKGKETLLYERCHLSSGDDYTFGLELEGGKDLHELWKKATGSQVLFISQAVANSSEKLNQLREPLEWLQEGFSSLSSETIEAYTNKIPELITRGHLPFAEEISSFLQDIDVPITRIRINQSELLELQSIEPKNKLLLTHRTVLGEAEFDFEDESDGTKNLIGFWLPWRIHKIDDANDVLIFDELDTSLHPEIVVSLVEKHLKSESPSQLIFTTHDTHLMDTKLLRRDQFWLTERDTNGATQLRSIHDFEGRNSEDMEKRYYEGRYRGLPFIRRG